MMSDNNKIFSDYLIDRSSLKTKISFWRNIAFVLLAFLTIQMISKNVLQEDFQKEYIARFKIDGEIFENSARNETINNLQSNSKIKAVILHIDSLGGGLYAGENLYHLLKKLSQTKPVVTVIESYAASAAYMVSLPSEKIFARKSSVTGSIGAWIMVPDVSKLADKIGVKMNMLKSGPLKAQPQPFDPMNEEIKKYTQHSVNEAYAIFIDMVRKDRKLKPAAINEISTGATFLGEKALQLGLIDQIGAEDEALNYLHQKHPSLKGLQIRNTKIKKRESKLNDILDIFEDVHKSFLKIKSNLKTIFNPSILL